MAIGACQAGMSPRQGKVAATVIKLRIVPIGGGMAGRTVGAKFPFVFIILLVTGIAVRGRAFELAINMTRLAIDFGVLTLQLKRGQVVIERCRRPTIDSVALTAIQSEASIVGFIVVMTGVAVLICGLEVA